MTNKLDVADKSLCPSYNGVDGAHLLGVRQENGQIAILPKALKIDKSFLANAAENHLSIRQRFRFAGKCIQKGCQNWSDKGCGIAIRVIASYDEATSGDSIPECSIRSECRWYKQEGQNICKMCPKVITDITAEEVNQYFADLIV